LTADQEIVVIQVSRHFVILTIFENQFLVYKKLGNKLQEMKNQILLLLPVMLLLSCVSSKTVNDKVEPITLDSKVDMIEPVTSDSRVDALLKKMTLEQKIGQMNQYTGFFDITGPAPEDGDTKVKYDQIKNGLVGSMLNVHGAEQVRALQKLAVENSPHGIPMIFANDVVHGYKTLSPIPLAEAASWDLEAIENSARIAAIEASAVGINWTFAPMVDISRDARWGRVMEGGGEDPFLGSKIAAARVKGFQGDDLSAINTIAACTKHFAAYGFAESGKDYNTTDIGTSTLYNVVLPPFKATVDADVATFMNSFNELNGIPATGDKYLQRTILKGEWGFKGMMVSDWGSIGEMIPHGFAKDGKQAAVIAANAGCDMDMESRLYIQHLKKAVEEGNVDMKHIDDAVRRILQLKENVGLFDDPYKYCDAQREKEMVYNEVLMDGVLHMAKKSIVLLKNESKLLPLESSDKKIALIGELAADKNGPLGNWRVSSDDNTAVSVKEAIEARTGNEITYEHGVKIFYGEQHFVQELGVNNDDPAGISNAVALAKKSDVVIMVLGEHGLQSGEGRSRADLGLPGLQQEMLEAVYEVNKNIILVLMNGRPLAIPWAAENVPTILEAWQLGTRSGDAIASVLYGEYNPSGKLPMTFPRDVGQVPIYYNHKSTGRPGPAPLVFWSHYNDMTNEPLFVFGHGESYTTFDYSNFSITGNQVSVKVTNSGDYDGEEVVQLYIRDKFASVVRPIKELKGFEKIFLAKGDSKTVNFTLTDELLGFYDNQGKYVVEDGEFDIMVGGSSATELSAEFVLNNQKKIP